VMIAQLPLLSLYIKCYRPHPYVWDGWMRNSNGPLSMVCGEYDNSASLGDTSTHQGEKPLAEQCFRMSYMSMVPDLEFGCYLSLN
jgi:hypothetical protein